MGVVIINVYNYQNKRIVIMNEIQPIGPPPNQGSSVIQPKSYYKILLESAVDPAAIVQNLVERIINLEKENEIFKSALNHIVELHTFASEIYTDDRDLADNLADHARKALKFKEK